MHHTDRDRRLGGVLCLLLLQLFVLFAHGYIDNPDAEVEFQTARALVRRGSTALAEHGPDTSAAERLIVNARHGVMQGRDGAYYSWFGPGHALVMVPFYVAGEWLSRLLPWVDARVRRIRSHQPDPFLREHTGEDFAAHLIASFHSPLFGALAGLALFRLLGHLGFAGPLRVAAVLVATLCSQFGPETRESMSDTTATCFLFWSLERALAWRYGRGDASAALAAGVGAGLAVLTRPNHLVVAGALATYMAYHVRRRGRVRDLGAFVAAVVPSGLFLLWFNWTRFGTPWESGYSAGTAHGYWNFPFWLGVVLLAVSPGKGVLWFCPVLFLVPVGLRRWWRENRGELLLLGSTFVAPWVLSSFMTGWHSSQAWACRYMTPGATLMVAVVACGMLEQWRARRSRRLVAALGSAAMLGFLINLGGWLTPYRGYFNVLLQHPAVVDALWPGVIAARGDPFQHLVSDPRTSPITGHWKYAWLVWRGTIPNGPGTEAFAVLTGTAIDAPVRPVFPEDYAFRHLWPIGLSWQLGSTIPAWLGVGLLVAAGRTGWRLARLCGTRDG